MYILNASQSIDDYLLLMWPMCIGCLLTLRVPTNETLKSRKDNL